MLKNRNVLKLNERNTAILVFSLFFSWLLSFPFEGQVLYSLLHKYNINSGSFIFKSIAAHLAGLITCAFYVKSLNSARKLIIASIILCIAGTSVFIFEPSFLWTVALVVSSFASGASVSAWGYYFKELATANERIKMAAEGLIFSNMLMVLINVVSANVSAYAGLSLSLLILGAGLFFAFKLISCNKDINDVKSHGSLNIVKPLALLSVFIFIITINSGLMYQVINPDFSHFEQMVSFYWALPYIAFIYIMRRLSGAKRTYMLYVAIAMIGLGFIAYLALERSAISYIVINTLMMGAFGVYDLFWWNILGEMLDYVANPAKVMGIGLSSNVLGVLVGGLIGNAIKTTENSKLNASLMALVVVFIILIILPILHNQLTILLKNHSYITSAKTKEVKEKKEEKLNIQELTERENQIAKLLLSGRTYKMIAEELFLSENTVKTHIKNIYSKLNIQSKTELVKMISEKQSFDI